MVFVGGNRTWRNQNPGNIGAGSLANRYGAIGRAGGFAVFPNYEIGRAAIFGLLKSPGYINQTIWDAIPRYAPAKENDVTWYRKYYVEEYGWLSKEQTMALISEGKVDGVIATSRNGNSYIRTHANSTSTDNIEVMG